MAGTSATSPVGRRHLAMPVGSQKKAIFQSRHKAECILAFNSSNAYGKE